MADDELQCIQAIYCRSDELQLSSGEDGSWQVCIKLSPVAEADSSVTHQAELCLSLPVTYPATPPSVTVFSNSISKDDLAKIRATLHQCAEQNIGQPMVMNLITAASEEILAVSHNPPAASPHCRPHCHSVDISHADDVSDRLVVLHIDHMKAKTSYTKQIKKWAQGLSLAGRLIFCQKLILLLLQGSAERLKNYILLHRTSTVDVDSRGHPCKERMMSVLCDVPLSKKEARFQDFEVREMTRYEELEALFSALFMPDIYDKYVKTLLH